MHAPESTPRQTHEVIGCDIGGANLKLANRHGKCISRTFPMWMKADQLAVALRELLIEFQLTSTTQLAVTMTGELADCFATRREGVQKILAQVEQAFAPERTQVYAVGNHWMSTREAVAAPWEVAASNWHALATWLGQFMEPSIDLVLDIGSTTVDIIPMQTGKHGFASPATKARTDRQRLELGQLVYTGLERTPVAAIVNELTVSGNRCPVMAERFATSDDCYVALQLTPESPDDCDSADNRPRTQANAHARLARMIGEDSETLPFESAQTIAAQIIDAQATQIATAIARNLPASATRIAAVGHGRALALRAIAKLRHPVPEVLWLADRISPSAARCAPALAVANLLADHLSKQK